jgi:hypothetical protein
MQTLRECKKEGKKRMECVIIINYIIQLVINSSSVLIYGNFVCMDICIIVCVK